MRKFKEITLFMVLCCVHVGYTQNKKTVDWKVKVLDYLNTMEEVLTPTGAQIYHMRFTTKTEFNSIHNIPAVETQTEMLVGEKKVFLDDENMKVFGDEENMFVVLPKVHKIYWNNSDPKVFANTSGHRKFLNIERALLQSSSSIQSEVKDGIVHINIIPTKEFEIKTGLTRQLLTYDENLKRVVGVDNRFNDKSKMKKQVVRYEIIDYKSSKKIKAPEAYIFEGSELASIYKGFQIVDNRKN